MIVLHGENTVASRQKLVELLSAARERGDEVIRFEASRLQVPELEIVLGTDDLFGSPKTIVIEELHSLPKSQKKTDLIQLLAARVNQSSETWKFILWEKRELTPTMLKQFPQAQSLVHKVSNAVFTWLDSLSPQRATQAKQLTLLHKATSADDAYLCFAMLIRQVRMLIQVADGTKVGGAPFMIAKLKKQAGLFTLAQLLKTHRRLLEIDTSIKTGKSVLNLDQHLDLLVLDL